VDESEVFTVQRAGIKQDLGTPRGLKNQLDRARREKTKKGKWEKAYAAQSGMANLVAQRGEVRRSKERISILSPGKWEGGDV